MNEIIEVIIIIIAILVISTYQVTWCWLQLAPAMAFRANYHVQPCPYRRNCSEREPVKLCVIDGKQRLRVRREGYTMNRARLTAEAGGGRRNDKLDGAKGQSGRVYV